MNLYKVKIFPVFSLFALFIGVQAIPDPAYAKMALPRPPLENPHPPITEADKNRVAFAEQAVSLWLLLPLPETIERVTAYNGPMVHQDKDLACLKQGACYLKDSFFIYELVNIHREHGEVTEFKHAHVIPWAFQQFQANQKDSKKKEMSGSVKSVAKMDDMGEPIAAPRLRADEYMVHLYAKFSKHSEWYHLDVIMTENAKGELFLRGFFTTVMPSGPSYLPPGVKC